MTPTATERPDPLPPTARALVDVQVVEQLARLLEPLYAESLIPAVLAIFSPYLAHHPGPTPAPTRTPTREPLPAAAAAVGLSHSELQVLRLLATGLPNAEIGRALYLAEDTVKSHLRRLNRKLQTRNRVQTVVRAYALQLIEHPTADVDDPEGSDAPGR